MEVFIGCSGFYYQGWIERFYPKDLSRSEWLSFYAKHFSTVEINSSFYRLPTESMLERWHALTPKAFRFALKGSRYITHIRRLKDVTEPITTFYKRVTLLGEKLGPILWQLPKNMPKSLQVLEQFGQLLSPEFLNVIEFRHVSWLNEEVYDCLSRYQLTFCVVSSPDPELEAFRKTTDTVYLRFHGAANWYHHNYSMKELKHYHQKASLLKPHRVYAYFNNEVAAFSIQNAAQFKKIVISNEYKKNDLFQGHSFVIK